LMGTAQDAVPFAVLAPVGTVVESARPEFRWRPLEGATGYRVTVVDDQAQRDVATSGPLPTGAEHGELRWRLPESAPPLRRGGPYRWYVVATLPGGEEVQSPDQTHTARFQVLAVPLAADLEKARALDPPSRLALGIAYARAGLRNEAEAEFMALLRSNPRSPIARHLPRSVRPVNPTHLPSP